MTLLSSLEVVVLALAALPSTVWEFEIVLLFGEDGLNFLGDFLGMEGIVGWGEVSLVEWLHSTG